MITMGKHDINGGRGDRGVGDHKLKNQKFQLKIKKILKILNGAKLSCIWRQTRIACSRVRTGQLARWQASLLSRGCSV